MIGEITQQNVHLLLPGKVTWMVEYLQNDFGMGLHQALRTIYRSQVYKNLSIEATKYWQWSPVDLYRELLAEDEQTDHAKDTERQGTTAQEKNEMERQGYYCVI